MKIATVLLSLALLSPCQLLVASGQQEDSLRLSPEFMRELESAFSLQPQQSADIVSIQPRTLDHEQLKEWIGPLPITPTMPLSTGAIPTMPQSAGVTPISIPGLSADDLTKYAYLWKHGQYGILRGDSATGSAGAFTGLDVNALGQYIRPKEIEQRRLHSLSAKIRPLMDRFFPTEGAPLYSKADTLVQK